MSRFCVSTSSARCATPTAKGDGGRTLARYEVEVEVLDALSKETPLRGEPSRAPVLLRHDRAVVRALQRWAKVEPRWLVCTADGWLRALLNDLEIVALDSVGLGDLLELVKPADAARALLAPPELAASIAEQERGFAASVWDETVELEGPALRDRDLVRRASSFRNVWLARRRDDTSLSDAWVHFRDTGALDER